MHPQTEAVCEERLHHEPHLVLGGVAGGFCLDKEVFVSCPTWKRRQQNLALLGVGSIL
jgi:hypothetical protein